jgi:hypothetical protein
VRSHTLLCVPTGVRGDALTLGWQGAGVAELLDAFDAVREKHEGMDPKEFNDDGTYKAGINQVRVV